MSAQPGGEGPAADLPNGPWGARKAPRGRAGAPPGTQAHPDEGLLGGLLDWLGPYDALVVAGSPDASPQTLRLLAPQCARVVAVDRGADLCRRAGVAPDLFVGDGDTVSPDGRLWAARTASVVSLSTEKDQTDLSVALDCVAAGPGHPGRADGPVHVALAGALGGAVDHQLAVLGVCRAHGSLAIDLVAQDACACVLSGCGRSELRLPGAGRRVSVIPLADGTVVSERGLAWELDRRRLTALTDLGVSNRTVSDDALVTCHEGCALVVVRG